MHLTSVSLLERLKQPDEDAWHRLHDLYRPLILNWLRRDPALRNDADDLVQEVLATLVKEMPEFQRQRTGSFRKWLKTVTLNRLKWHWRKKKEKSADSSPSLLADLEDPASSLSKQWEKEHDQHVMQRLIQMVEPDYETSTWAAFRLVVLHERNPADVADELGISVNAVLLAKSRILKRLREEAAGLIE